MHSDERTGIAREMVWRTHWVAGKVAADASDNYIKYVTFKTILTFLNIVLDIDNWEEIMAQILLSMLYSSAQCVLSWFIIMLCKLLAHYRASLALCIHLDLKWMNTKTILLCPLSNLMGLYKAPLHKFMDGHIDVNLIILAYLQMAVNMGFKVLRLYETIPRIL